tara:strand:- start:181 stop:423 length:243 start_codon:yes stop_codon:yes gene_type:complete
MISVCQIDEVNQGIEASQKNQETHLYLADPPVTYLVCQSTRKTQAQRASHSYPYTHNLRVISVCQLPRKTQDQKASHGKK